MGAIADGRGGRFPTAFVSDQPLASRAAGFFMRSRRTCPSNLLAALRGECKTRSLPTHFDLVFDFRHAFDLSQGFLRHLLLEVGS